MIRFQILASHLRSHQENILMATGSDELVLTQQEVRERERKNAQWINRLLTNRRQTEPVWHILQFCFCKLLC